MAGIHPDLEVVGRSERVIATKALNIDYTLRIVDCGALVVCLRTIATTTQEPEGRGAEFRRTRSNSRYCAGS
jgi:hypothetical protein